jgi:transposase
LRTISDLAEVFSRFGAFERSIIQPLLPNKPRGVPRADDRKVLNGIYWKPPRRRQARRNPHLVAAE